MLGMSPLDKVMVIVKSATDSFTLLSNAAGLYTTPLKSETDYKLTFYKPGYFSKNTTVTTVGKRNQDSTLISILAYAELDKIFPQRNCDSEYLLRLQQSNITSGIESGIGFYFGVLFR